jgi:hypothetical protein
MGRFAPGRDSVLGFLSGFLPLATMKRKRWDMGPGRLRDTCHFYPSSCVPVTRREFLSFVSTGLATTTALMVARPSAARAAKKPDDGTEGGMRRLIDQYASAREDPWRIAHGIRARGKEFTLSRGAPAVRYLLATHTVDQEVNGKRILHVPIGVEAHTNLFLNNLLEAGVPRLYAFQAQGRTRTVEDLIEGAKLRLDPAKVHPNGIAWSLVSLTTAVPPTSGRWVNAWGQEVRLAEFAERAFQVAEGATEDVRRNWMKHEPLAGKSAIHEFTCGGTHLIYSLTVAVKNGYQVRNGAHRLRDQLGMLIYRMWADLDLIDRFFTNVPGASGPPVAWFKLDAKWKFLGHAFEVYHYALAHRLFRPSQAEVRVVEEALRVFPRLAREVEAVDLDAARAHNLDLFRQLVGDTCHAYRGIHLQ